MANNETSGDKTLPTDGMTVIDHSVNCAQQVITGIIPQEEERSKKHVPKYILGDEAKVNSIHCVFPSEWKVQTIFLRLHVHIIYP